MIFSFSRALLYPLLPRFAPPRARYMGGKKRPERSIRSARKDSICVSAVGDQRIGSSRSAGVSLGHARSESHSSGVCSPPTAQPAPSLPGPPGSLSLSLSRCVSLSSRNIVSPSSLSRPKHASRGPIYTSLLSLSLSLSRESDFCLFYRTGSYGFSMRGRTTDIGRLITCLRGSSHSRRRR